MMMMMMMMMMIIIEVLRGFVVAFRCAIDRRIDPQDIMCLRVRFMVYSMLERVCQRVCWRMC